MVPLAVGSLDAGAPRTLVQVATAVVSLALVVGGGELFTTGIEWVGDRLDVSESATGSVFAALATTAPETFIPVLAILQGQGASVGVGAILGGPITLTTLSMLLIGVAGLVYARRGTRDSAIAANGVQVKRDLRVFLVGFTAALLVAFLPRGMVVLAAAAFLPALYVAYLYRISRTSSGGETTDPEPLEFGKWRDDVGRLLASSDGDRDAATEPSNPMVAAQVAVAVGLLLVGSHLLVGVIEWASRTVVPVPTTIVALLVAPVVSNLPEHVDGVIWVARGKDSLAVEQATGTLAFQGTVLAALGIAATPWRLSPTWGGADFLIVGSVVVALASGGVLYLRTAVAGDDPLSPRLLVGVGSLYPLYLLAIAAYVLAGLL